MMNTGGMWLIDRCSYCGRFMANFCLHCEGAQTTLEGAPISDTSYRVSVNQDTYQCHKCTKRSWCKLRNSEKLWDGYEERKGCDQFVEDHGWWL